MLDLLMNLKQEQIEEAQAMSKNWMKEYTYSPHNQKNFKLEKLSNKFDVGGITENSYFLLLLGFALAKVSEEQTVDSEKCQEEA